MILTSAVEYYKRQNLIFRTKSNLNKISQKGDCPQSGKISQKGDCPQNEKK